MRTAGGRQLLAAIILMMPLTSAPVAQAAPVAGTPDIAAVANQPMEVLPNKHAFVTVQVNGKRFSARIEPDSDESYLTGHARQLLGLTVKDGKASLPAFRLDGADTAMVKAEVCTPEQEARWRKERPDLLGIIGLDVLRRQPMLFDPARHRFGWGAYLRRSADRAIAVPMQAKVPGVPVVTLTIDGQPVRVVVAPWAEGLMVHGESAVGRHLLTGRTFKAEVPWGRYNWAMPTGEHVVGLAGYPLGKAIVNVLAPYTPDPESDKELSYVVEGWEGQLAPASLADWAIVVDYPGQQVRLQPLR